MDPLLLQLLYLVHATEAPVDKSVEEFFRDSSKLSNIDRGAFLSFLKEWNEKQPDPKSTEALDILNLLDPYYKTRLKTFKNQEDLAYFVKLLWEVENKTLSRSEADTRYNDYLKLSPKKRNALLTSAGASSKPTASLAAQATLIPAPAPTIQTVVRAPAQATFMAVRAPTTQTAAPAPAAQSSSTFITAPAPTTQTAAPAPGVQSNFITAPAPGAQSNFITAPAPAPSKTKYKDHLVYSNYFRLRKHDALYKMQTELKVDRDIARKIYEKGGEAEVSDEDEKLVKDKMLQLPKKLPSRLKPGVPRVSAAPAPTPLVTLASPGAVPGLSAAPAPTPLVTIAAPVVPVAQQVRKANAPPPPPTLAVNAPPKPPTLAPKAASLSSDSSSGSDSDVNAVVGRAKQSLNDLMASKIRRRRVRVGSDAEESDSEQSNSDFGGGATRLRDWRGNILFW